MSNNVPLRQRIIEKLTEYPEGLTSVELEACIGVYRATISSMVSKIHMYGGPIEKTGNGYGPGHKWRLRKQQQPKADAHGSGHRPPVRPA